MKAIILYATKHGAAKEIAERIAKRLPGSMIYDLKDGGIPPVSQFDCVVLGSSIYAGAIHKEAKTFLTNNADTLRDKCLGLFLSGMDASREKEFFDANFPAEVLQTATVKSFLGGIFDPKKAGLIERFIMKAVAKQSAYSDTILDDKIGQFAEVIEKQKN